MREWNLKAGDPLSLTLGADARVGSTDYSNDQIWELTLGGGEPPALALQTTYGLRARSLRLFPRFTEGDQTQTDPGSFAGPPVIRRFYPNYLLLGFSPLPNIDVEAEYWVPESQGVAGRFTMTNQGQAVRQIRLEFVAQLTPTDGQRMAPMELQAAPVLAGSTGGLAPVVFLTGGAQTGKGSYPALTIDLELPPGGTRRLIWSHAALPQVEDSFNSARKLAARHWEAEIARLELLNAGQIDIHTWNPDWDIVFALTQKLAYGLFVSPTDHLPSASFVYNRLPDQGYSLRGDGSDYNHLWNGQTPLEAYYLAGMILPCAPDLAQGLLTNFLATQAEDGSVDWKPGLAGQRSRLLATPLLASLAWRIYQSTEDIAFLEQTFPALLAFVHSWFSSDQDRDGDGVPEWDHSMQTGFDDHPVFSRWQPWSLGVDVSTAESPSLCAFLYRECQSLIQMAGLLNRPEAITALQTIAEHQRTVLETAWNDTDAAYYYWDRDTHHTTHGERLADRIGPGKIELDTSFDLPARLLIQVQTGGDATRHPEGFVYGKSATGQPRVEHFTKDQFKWYLGRGTLTGERVYAHVDQIDIQGLGDSDLVTVYTVDYCHQDHTTLLPLWACIPNPDRADALVQRTITSPQGYWHPFGIPACPKLPGPCESPYVYSLGEMYPPDTVICQSTHLIWNTLVGEGLLNYGYRSEAAELVSRLMAAIIRTVKQDHAFRRHHHADTGQGLGEWNTVDGLAPLGLFLDTLGVRIISPQKVALQGFNPFPGPVTVKYRGITILRQKENTTVIFPDGQTVHVDDPTPRIVSLEKVPV